VHGQVVDVLERRGTSPTAHEQHDRDLHAAFDDSCARHAATPGRMDAMFGGAMNVVISPRSPA
jgi:hypothetical protein